jgi:DNA polymerase-2
MTEHHGWLLDLYADPQDGVVVWLINKDGPLRLQQNFPVTFYAAGPAKGLRALWRFLRAQPIPVELARVERRDLFQQLPVSVLAATVAQAAEQPRLFAQASRQFPDLTYYDADLPLALRFAAVHGTFPLAKCKVDADSEGVVQQIEVRDSPWLLDPAPAPLQVMSLELDQNPSHAPPQSLEIRCGRAEYHLSLKSARPLLINLTALLRRFDPDLLLTSWGDTWLLPHLLELAEQSGLPLPLNRDPGRVVERRPERIYFAYGQVIYRGAQTRLFGRAHIDVCNAVLYGDYGLSGVLEMARVTGLPLQGAARLSPGTGISAMQIVTALRQGVLVPYHKQQAETPKPASQLILADQGGLVYQPKIGLHRDVGEVDFVSMYPSIMEHFNISPETVGDHLPRAQRVAELDLWVDTETRGLVPDTLKPLLDKRLALKAELATMPRWHPRRKDYEAHASAYKWLLVTCFGYLGYKNARFGRIEAHQAVTAYGREALLRAKEAAEDLGFEVLHLYVDGLWVKKEGASAVADFQPLLDEILDRTGLPIALDGVYRWVAFLPSRTNARVPVANRYFGVFQNDSTKVRGIEIRRRDTPPFIVQTQKAMLERLAKVRRVDDLPSVMPVLVRLLQDRLADLRRGRIPTADLLVSQQLSRALEEYRSPSPAARAAAQLQAIGKERRPGQRIRFVYTRGVPGVYAWDLPDPPNPVTVDVARYEILLLRAAATIFQPLGVEEHTLRDWLFSNAGYLAPPGWLPNPLTKKPPLWAHQAVARAG